MTLSETDRGRGKGDRMEIREELGMGVKGLGKKMKGAGFIIFAMNCGMKYTYAEQLVDIVS